MSIDIFLLDKLNQVCETDHEIAEALITIIIIAFHHENRRKGSADHINILKRLYQTMLIPCYQHTPQQKGVLGIAMGQLG